MKRFEYKKSNENLTEGELNKLGSKGWELVAHSILTGIDIIIPTYVFKRELGKIPSGITYISSDIG